MQVAIALQGVDRKGQKWGIWRCSQTLSQIRCAPRAASRTAAELFGLICYKHVAPDGALVRADLRPRLRRGRYSLDNLLNVNVFGDDVADDRDFLGVGGAGFDDEIVDLGRDLIAIVFCDHKRRLDGANDF